LEFNDFDVRSYNAAEERSMIDRYIRVRTLDMVFAASATSTLDGGQLFQASVLQRRSLGLPIQGKMKDIRTFRLFYGVHTYTGRVAARLVNKPGGAGRTCQILVCRASAEGSHVHVKELDLTPSMCNGVLDIIDTFVIRGACSVVLQC
jgi:hypothetical protein